jgi:hypothetical protein
VLAFALLIPVSCGSESGPGKDSTTLSAAEESLVFHARTSLQSYCARLALYLAGRRAAPSESDARRVDGYLDRLIDVARAKPEGRERSGATMRQLLGDMAENLEGSNCSGGFEQKLDQGLETLPPPE